MTRRVEVLVLAVGLAAASMVGPAGCKRRRAPPVEEVWDDIATPDQTASSTLAPSWSHPVRARLDNGLGVYWLFEPDSPRVHLRVLMAAPLRPPAGGPAAIAVAAEHVRFQLVKRTTQLDADVELTHGPGRIEIVVHGDEDHLEELLEVLGTTFGTSPGSVELDRARARFLEDLDPPSADTAGLAELTSRLLGSPQLVTSRAVRALPGQGLEGGWESLTDPRGVVLVVHAGRSADQARDGMRDMADGWRGTGRRSDELAGLKRLRSAEATPRRGGRVVGDSPIPMTVAEGRGRPVLYLGRLVPTPDLATRAAARLAQRILQEEFDARATVHGSETVFVFRVELPRRGADRAVQKALDELSAFATTRHQTQRLHQAAQLWLGASVVEASLRNEDWTLLFRRALDLADDERGVASVLGRHASVMLGIEPDTLVEWQRDWLDPKGGETGWDWVVSGADPGVLRQLRGVADVRTPPG